MATQNNDYYIMPWASETSEILEKMGFVNTEDQIEDNRSAFHLIINTRKSTFFVVDQNNLDKYSEVLENLGEKLNPITTNEIEKWH